MSNNKSLVALTLVVFSLTCIEQSMTAFPKIDWVEDGFVTPAENQEPCNSCWAFPTVGLIEFWHRKKTGNLLEFSEQNLIDCGKGHDGLHGCEKKNGGNVKTGLDAIIKNGIYLQSDYKWVGRDQNCKKLPNATLYYKKANFIAKPLGDKDALNLHLKNGPATGYVYVDEKNSTWFDFKGKGLLEVHCKGRAVNHAILIVGSGNYKGQDYYLIKNSWGKDFGDEGFAKLSTRRSYDSCLQRYFIIQ